jgi:hypothetical protein
MGPILSMAGATPRMVMIANTHLGQQPGAGSLVDLDQTRNCSRFPWRRDQVKIDGQWKSVRFTP